MAIDDYEWRLQLVRQMLDPATPAPQRQVAALTLPVTARVIDRVRMDDEGCWHWKLRMSVSNQPMMKIRYKDHFTRRLLWEELHNRPMGELRARMKCECERCVSPFCLEGITVSKQHKLAWQRGSWTQDRSIKMALTKRAASAMTEEKAAYIRTTTGKTLKQMADELGVSRSLVSKVRRGEAWRDLRSPFAELARYGA